MCVVSMVMDHYGDKWGTPNIVNTPNYQVSFTPQIPTQLEIDEFYKLLKRAREYDKKHNQPNCELDEKKTKIKNIAKKLGVEIIFPDDDDPKLLNE